MEEVINLLVTEREIDLLREYSARIRFLYDVNIRSEIQQHQTVQESLQKTGSYLQLKIWVWSMIDRSSTVAKAKKYIHSVCSIDRIERRCQYTQEIFHFLLRSRDRIERLSGAVLVFNTFEHEVLVWGLEYNVTNALYMLDQTAQQFVSQSNKTTIAQEVPSLREPISRKCSSIVPSDNNYRRKLEAVDSSYDSDCDSYTQAEVDHDDISRTVSDTLGAEFAEYINIDTDKLVSSLCESDHSTEDTSDESSASSDGQYTNRVEFALKLGYTEDQVQLALQKLGSNPEQNELLAELIKLSSSSTNAKHIEESEFDVSESSKHPFDEASESSNLRHIVIDGSNVAMSHGKKETFSCKGIKICIDWFKQRGHKEITVFVPQFRKETSFQEPRITDQDILFQLEREGMISFTPSRQVGGRRLICYDDRYILNLAAAVDGIVVSNDNYRDLINESQEFKKTVDERLLMYTFVSDRFMPPDDPLGRHGPSLDNFLKKRTKTSDSSLKICPYLKKCTYGNKCKYQHPERGNMPQKLVSEILAEQGKHQIQERKSRGNKSSLRSTVSLPAMSSSEKKKELPTKKLLCRTSTNLHRKVTDRMHDKGADEPGQRGKLMHTSSSPLASSEPMMMMQMMPKNHPKSNFDKSQKQVNHHRKLQREPCVNPNKNSLMVPTFDDQRRNHHAKHPPVSRKNFSSKWGSVSNHLSVWGTDQQSEEGHQAVTRIASAPDSYQQQWSSFNQPRFAMKVRQASTSDSQLNVFNESVNNTMLPQFSWMKPQASTWANNSVFSNEDHHASPYGNIPAMVVGSNSQQQMTSVDPDLIFHLCSLFPPEHVRTVMQMYPNENDAKKLCAAILRIFPPSCSNE